MPSKSEKLQKTRNSASDYGIARVRDKAFDAVMQLWDRRQAEGVQLKDVAEKIGADKGWISKQFRGPGNWTLKTFGSLVEALDGEAEIRVFAIEDPVDNPSNYDAYLDYPTVHLDTGTGQISIGRTHTITTANSANAPQITTVSGHSQ